MLYEVKPNSKKVPPGGKWFINEDGFLFEAVEPKDVAEQLRNYRIEHNKQLGEPYQDVLHNVCDKYPYLCNYRTEKPAQDDKQQISADIHHKILSKQSSIGELEIDMIAKDRAKVCKDCPYHAPDIKLGSDEERQRYEKLVAILTHGKSLKMPELGVCLDQKDDCRYLCYSNDNDFNSPNYTGCWINKIKKN